MKHFSSLLIFVSIICISGFTWAASCKRCYEKISDDKQFCTECELSTSGRLTDMKSREEQITSAIISARENYKSALEELIQHYLDIGNHFRLKKTREELKALNTVPQRKYLSAKEIIIEIGPSKNIEEANILFQDGKIYRNPLNLTKMSKNLALAVARFSKILDDYPESDRADDAAYELAEIYEGSYYRDYENAVSYYVKCYNLNKNTEKSARFKAARVYDKHLQNYAEAARHYEMALETCNESEYRKIAKTRLGELRHQGY